MTAQSPLADPGIIGSGRLKHRGIIPLTSIMGRATDPGENHDPGRDQHLIWSLTQQPRLENGLSAANKLRLIHSWGFDTVQSSIRQAAGPQPWTPVGPQVKLNWRALLDSNQRPTA